MPTDLNTMFNLGNEQAKKLAQIIQMINNTATDPMIRTHLVSHFEAKLKDRSEKGCTLEIDALLEICFKTFSDDEIRILIEQITPHGVQSFNGSFEDFIDFIMKRESK